MTQTGYVFDIFVVYSTRTDHTITTQTREDADRTLKVAKSNPSSFDSILSDAAPPLARGHRLRVDVHGHLRTPASSLPSAQSHESGAGLVTLALPSASRRSVVSPPGSRSRRCPRCSRPTTRQKSPVHRGEHLVLGRVRQTAQVQARPRDLDREVHRERRAPWTRSPPPRAARPGSAGTESRRRHWWLVRR